MTNSTNTTVATATTSSSSSIIGSVLKAAIFLPTNIVVATTSYSVGVAISIADEITGGEGKLGEEIVKMATQSPVQIASEYYNAGESVVQFSSSSLRAMFTTPTTIEETK